MRTGTCERDGCDVTFIDRTRGRNRRFCSDNCRKRHQEHTTGRGVCIDCGRTMGVGTKHGGYERCARCRHDFDRQRIHERALRIKGWWDEGLTLREIAERLGWSRIHAAVEVHRLREEGYDFPNRPRCGLAAIVTFDTEEAAAKYRAGWSCERIAASLGCSKETVRRRLNEYGVQMRRGPRKAAA